jgi:hypothetical protein|tara:strand:- start:2808 stop:3263 length:456 start_codon:yes stop_codon:yes gene_type:complete
MTQDEFKAFLEVIEKQYPKQQPLNNVQKGMFWLSLQKFPLDDCMSAFLLHCESSDGEWKPQVCHITKYIKVSEERVKSMFNDFFQRREVKDKRAVAIYNKLGGLSMHKLPKSETDKKADLFVKMYMEGEARKTFDELPQKLKTQLIGGPKK